MRRPLSPRQGLFCLLLAVLILLAGCRNDSAEAPPAPVPKAAAKAADPLADWKPAFDPGGAEYTYLLSCIGHPAIEGVAAGYRIRDRVWEKSGGRLYVDFRPLAQLGGEKDVISKLKLGAVQGMMSSSVAAANISDRLGLVNLPFVLESFDKLERFRTDPALFDAYRSDAREQGIEVIDFTGYGSYGWASTRPVSSLEAARGVNFRIAEAPVNTDIYKAWGLKFTIMPWPDVPQALQTGVIDGLDHTPIVCNISRKFEVAGHFTRVDYAQGLYIHLANRRWLERLPEDLREILIDTIEEESATARELTRVQQREEIDKAQSSGVAFAELAPGERKRLVELSAPVYEKWGEKIGRDYLERVRTAMAGEEL